MPELSMHTARSWHTLGRKLFRECVGVRIETMRRAVKAGLWPGGSNHVGRPTTDLCLGSARGVALDTSEAFYTDTLTRKYTYEHPVLPNHDHGRSDPSGGTNLALVGPKLMDSVPNWADLGAVRIRAAFGPNLVDSGPMLVECGPTRSKVVRIQTKFGRTRSRPGQLWPTSWSGLWSRNRAEYCRVRAEFGRFGPQLAEFPNSAQHRSKSTRVEPIPATCPICWSNLPRCVEIGPNSPDFGTHGHKLSQIRPASQ